MSVRYVSQISSYTKQWTYWLRYSCTNTHTPVLCDLMLPVIHWKSIVYKSITLLMFFIPENGLQHVSLHLFTSQIVSGVCVIRISFGGQNPLSMSRRLSMATWEPLEMLVWVDVLTREEVFWNFSYTHVTNIPKSYFVIERLCRYRPLISKQIQKFENTVYCWSRWIEIKWERSSSW